jgi:hypothetical protein
VAELNERYRLGGPSSDLEAAGVVVRIFDLLSSGWRLSNQYISASLINRRLPTFYEGGSSGILMRVTNLNLRCAYTFDTNTMAQSDPCSLPTCGSASAVDYTGIWGTGCWCPACAYPPAALGAMMRWQEEQSCCRSQSNASRPTYNELIFDVTETQLEPAPASYVRAFVFHDVLESEDGRRATTSLHAAFVLQHSPHASTCDSVPLVSYNPDRPMAFAWVDGLYL